MYNFGMVGPFRVLPLRVLRLALQRVIEAVHERADQEATDVLTHVAQAPAGPERAYTCRQQRRLWIAARLRLHRHAQIAKQARPVSPTDARPRSERARNRGIEDDVLLMPDMGE